MKMVINYGRVSRACELDFNMTRDRVHVNASKQLM